MESVGGYAYFVSEGTLSADPKFLFFFFLTIVSFVRRLLAIAGVNRRES